MSEQNHIYSVSVVIQRNTKDGTESKIVTWAYTSAEVANSHEALGKFIYEKAGIKDGWYLFMWTLNKIDLAK